jgi:hypothetical protein
VNEQIYRIANSIADEEKDLDANGCGKKTGRQAESDQTSSNCRTEPDTKSVALEKRKIGLKND